MGKLGGVGKVMYRELEPGVCNPEGFSGRDREESMDLEETGGLLTNREVYNYIKDCSIAKSHKLSGVVGKHSYP